MTKYILEYFIHGLFWLVMYYALRGLTISSFQFIDHTPGRDATVRVGHALFPYAWLVLIFLMLLFYSCTLWLFPKTTRYKSGYTLGAIIGWLSLVYGTCYLLLRTLIDTRKGYQIIVQDTPGMPDPLRSPDSGVLTVLSGNWSHLQTVIALSFMAVLGIAAAYFFIREKMRNELARTRAEGLHLDTELRFLRSQLSPHFLFNTLNNLFGMALKEGNRNLADRIATLSNMMRYALYESNSDNVSLEKEIGCMKDYLALHGMRYDSNEAEVSFVHPEPNTIATIQVAPMLFVPFLENAFKHGIAIGHRSKIALTITASPKKLDFTCENTNHSNFKKLDEGGIGLENVKRRLELLYPGRHVLRSGPHDDKYIVNLQIALI